MRPWLPTNEDPAHAIRSLPSKRVVLLFVAPRHMATFDYLDMQMIPRKEDTEYTKGIHGWRTDGRRNMLEYGKSHSFETTNNFLLNSLSASRKLAIKLSGKIEKHRREGVDFPPLERYPFPAEGSHCWPGICMSTHFPTRVRGMEGRSRSAMPPPSGGMLIFRAYARRTPPFHRRVSSTPTSTDPPSSTSAPIFFVIYRPLARRSFTYRSEPLLLPLSLYPLPSDTRVN